jgi:hypothetical protein
MFKNFQKFSGLLKVRLDLPQNIEMQTFCIDLEGESCISQICILEPPLVSNEKSVIDFGLSFIHEKRQKLCKIQNIGQLTDNLMIELLDDINNVYSIYLELDANELSCGCIVDKNGS